MYQGDVALFVIVHQLLLAQPLEQFLAIRCVEDLAQGIGLLQALDIAPDGQQVQVVIAQHAHQGVAHGIKKAQGFQRLWAAVDQIANQPQAILGRVESDFFKQALQRLQAALQVTDGISRHQCRAPGTARRKGR